MEMKTNWNGSTAAIILHLSHRKTEENKKQKSTTTAINTFQNENSVEIMCIFDYEMTENR